MNIYENIFNLQKAVDNLKFSVKAWKCKKDLYSLDNPYVRDFIKDRIYSRTESCTYLSLIDEHNRPHILGDWEKYFTNVSEHIR